MWSMPTQRQFLPFVLAIVLGYAMYQRLQAVAMAALVLLFLTAYPNVSRRLIDRGEGLVRRTSSARFKDIEVQLGDRVVQWRPDEPLGLVALLQEMHPETMSLLLAIDREKTFPLSEAIRERTC